MEAHQQRVVDEEMELDTRLEKLHVFIEDSSIFKSLTKINQRLLIDQRCVMSQYRDILRERIRIF
jgi:hypothetical protein